MPDQVCRRSMLSDEVTKDEDKESKDKDKDSAPHYVCDADPALKPDPGAGSRTRKLAGGVVYT